MINKCNGIAITGALIFAACLTGAETSTDLEIKRDYKNLIDAENRHDLGAVKGLVWNSPSTLFVAKAPVGWHGYWGIEDVIGHLHDMYQQPFRIDPVYEEERVVLPHARCRRDLRTGQNHGRLWRSESGSEGVHNGAAMDQDSGGMEDDDGYPDPDSAGPHGTVSE